MLYVREFSGGGQPGPIGRAGEVDLGSQNDCEFVDAGGLSRWHTSSKRNLPNQLMDQGVPERIDVLRGGDKGAGAADDVVSVVVRKRAWSVGVIGLRGSLSLRHDDEPIGRDSLCDRVLPRRSDIATGIVVAVP